MNKIITKKGEGQKVEAGDTVVIHYIGKLLDGTNLIVPKIEENLL
jgi:FKBP-type peptidyl-prolyl cis-trans isomerase